MKYAIINGTKAEATKGVKGTCPSCGSELIAKCGEHKINHWAHKGIRNCDPWWENETHWHRNWKNQFPLKWQEVIHSDVSGERHIADVKTDEGWVLEFQNSPIKAEERISRNNFYSKIVWIVNGRRLSNDVKKFQELLNSNPPIMYGRKIAIFKIVTPNKSRLLREWSGAKIPVFLDFQEPNSRIWLILPRESKDVVYTFGFSGSEFVGLHNQKGFNELAFEIIPEVNNFLNRKYKGPF